MSICWGKIEREWVSGAEWKQEILASPIFVSYPLLSFFVGAYQPLLNIANWVGQSLQTETIKYIFPLTFPNLIEQKTTPFHKL